MRTVVRDTSVVVTFAFLGIHDASGGAITVLIIRFIGILDFEETRDDSRGLQPHDRVTPAVFQRNRSRADQPPLNCVSPSLCMRFCRKRGGGGESQEHSGRNAHSLRVYNVTQSKLKKRAQNAAESRDAAVVLRC